MEFQEITVNATRAKAQKVLCSAIKVPFIINRPRTNLKVLQGMEFQENHSKGRRGTAESVPCSQSKVPFIIDRSRLHLPVQQAIGLECLIWSFRKIPGIEDEKNPRNCFVLQVKCPLVLTYRDRTYMFCGEEPLDGMCGVSR